MRGRKSLNSFSFDGVMWHFWAVRSVRLQQLRPGLHREVTTLAYVSRLLSEERVNSELNLLSVALCHESPAEE